MAVLHEGNYDLCHLLESLIFVDLYRADSNNTEYLLKAFYCLIKIIISITIHVDSSVTFVYKEFSVYALQSITNLTYQCIFKDITVLSLNSDLAVFYQN